MHESKFYLIEGKEINMVELGQELESIIGRPVVAPETNSERYVTQKPNIESDNDTFKLKYYVENSDDYISVVATTDKKLNTEDHDFRNEKLRIDLISYISEDQPKDNYSDNIDGDN